MKESGIWPGKWEGWTYVQEMPRRYASTVRWKSNVAIVVRDLEGRIIDRQELHNQIKDVGLNILRDALNGTVAEIRYLAWGTDSTANATNQTKLVAESGRKAVTTQAAGGTGVMVTTTYIAPYEAIVSIEELGWFAGTGATAVADSGVLVSRVLYSRAKTALESIQVVRTDTFTEV